MEPHHADDGTVARAQEAHRDGAVSAGQEMRSTDSAPCQTQGMRRGAAAQDLAASGGRDARVEIVAYDPHWTALFEAEATRLQRAVPGLELHHIGSTAVPGLRAKPVVDMIALVTDLEEFVGPIVAAGYEYPSAYNATLEGRRWFCRPSAAIRTHHLHLVTDPQVLDRHLLLRDVLRRDPDLAAEYADLKLHLAQRFPNDREAYTHHKSDFINRVLTRHGDRPPS